MVTARAVVIGQTVGFGNVGTLIIVIKKFILYSMLVHFQMFIVDHCKRGRAHAALQLCVNLYVGVVHVKENKVIDHYLLSFCASGRCLARIWR